MYKSKNFDSKIKKRDVKFLCFYIKTDRTHCIKLRIFLTNIFK